MTETKKTGHRGGRIALSVLLGLLALVLAAAIAVFALWHNEISTFASLEQVRERNDEHLDGSVYTIQVKGDFYLDDFVAQGGVSNDQELIVFVSGHLTKGLVDLEINSPPIGCSSFTASTPDGKALFARNYDFSKTNTCLVFTEANPGRHASISTTDLQFLGIDVDKDLELMDKILTLATPYIPLDGINDAGVACGVYMTYQGGETTVPTDQQTDLPDFTSTTLLRLILDYADSVEEAVEIAQSYDMHDSANTSYHYMVADDTGRSAILEWVGETDAADNDGAQRRLVVTYNDADDHIGPQETGADNQVITNFILEPGYYAASPAEDMKGRDRYEEIWAQLNDRQGVVADEQDAMDILEVVGRRSWKNDDKNGCTVHSAVYNLTDRSVLWVSNENFDDPTAVMTFQVGK